MLATIPRPITVEEFAGLPEDAGGVYHELRRGGAVAATRAKYGHYTIQRRLRRLLENLAPVDALVDTEFSFRPLPEYELWVADVVFLSAAREQGIDPQGYLEGAPEIVIEVLSPSNTGAEISDKEEICLQNGAQEFWVVDPANRLVKVSAPDGITRTWRSGQQIPVPMLGTDSIAVDAIFV